MVEKEVAVLLVRRHRRAVGVAVRRAVDDEVPGAVEEEAGPAAVRRVPQAFWMRCLYMPLVRLDTHPSALHTRARPYLLSRR